MIRSDFHRKYRYLHTKRLHDDVWNSMLLYYIIFVVCILFPICKFWPTIFANIYISSTQTGTHTLWRVLMMLNWMFCFRWVSFKKSKHPWVKGHLQQQTHLRDCDTSAWLHTRVSLRKTKHALTIAAVHVKCEDSLFWHMCVCVCDTSGSFIYNLFNFGFLNTVLSRFLGRGRSCVRSSFRLHPHLWIHLSIRVPLR